MSKGALKSMSLEFKTENIKLEAGYGGANL